MQDVTIGTRVSRTAYQYTLMDTDAAELARWTPMLRAALARSPALADVASDQANDGFSTFITVDRDAAMRLGVLVGSALSGIIGTIVLSLAARGSFPPIRVGHRRRSGNSSSSPARDAAQMPRMPSSWAR